ncbi:hypothetical protein SAMN05216567_106421 [Variovorax sp. OK605]|uniref:hypothetical protein n=1 Tax=Variovorax sp. OK605 TaxID=1855317 RepID=UPI0008EFF651|nr:hypothetical protein [Variovorax sp. OK605]SFP50289.1 hypothetical protein SAMN05216567_106421 [Variovorax sp. OK605]
MIPSFPEDATLRSLLIAFKSCGHYGDSDYLDESIGVAVKMENAYAMHAGSFATKIFDNAVAPDDLLSKHSQAGIWGKLLKEEDELRWRRALINGDARAANAYVPTGTSGLIRPKLNRICLECLEEDFSLFGFGHYHVLHQVPLLSHCTRHAARLRSCCPICQPSQRLRPAHSRCARCKFSPLPVLDVIPYEQTEDYAWTVRLIEEMYRGEAPALRPRDRQQLVGATFPRDSMVFRRVELLEQFMSAWGFEDLATLQETFRIHKSASTVSACLEGYPSFVTHSLRVASIAFALRRAPQSWESAAPASAAQSFGLFTPPMHVAEKHVAAAAARIEEEGFPAGTLQLLFEGGTRKDAAVVLGVSAALLYALECRLPVECTSALEEARNQRPKKKAKKTKRRSRPNIGQRDRRIAKLPEMRKAALAAREKGVKRKKQLALHARSVYAFLVRYDREWLQNHFPSARKNERNSTSQKRAAYRKLALAAKRKMEGRSLPAIDRATWNWLKRSDFKWLNEQFPEANLRVPPNGPHYRMLAEAAYNERRVTQHGYPKIPENARIWLARYDREWLEQQAEPHRLINARELPRIFRRPSRKKLPDVV